MNEGKKNLTNPHLLKGGRKSFTSAVAQSRKMSVSEPSEGETKEERTIPTAIPTTKKDDSTPTIPKMATELSSSALDLTLLSNFVHQVINPLNGVIGTLDNVIDGTVSGPRKDQRLKAVRAQLEWTVMLVRNLAYFAGTALTPGVPQNIETKKCVVPELVIEAAQFFQEIASTHGMDVELTDKSSQYCVDGSPDLLRQVFMNLIDNAVKYSDAGAQIKIIPWVQKTTNALIIEIQNKGAGFKASERERLFEVGFRGDEAKAMVKSGTGLGLYICRRIMQDVHHGTIEAEHSFNQRTTTLRLRFPKWRFA